MDTLSVLKEDQYEDLQSAVFQAFSEILLLICVTDTT
jgi:hypothetical protein